MAVTISLTQLTAFITASRLESFSAAAQELGLSQPAVSDLIRRLELDVEARLFERLPRGLVLTSAGGELLPYAEQSVRAALDGRNAVRALHDLTGGQATFGLFKNADHYLGADLPARFKRGYPGVRLRLIAAGSPETVAAIRAGRVEAGIVALPVDDEGLSALPAARDEIRYLTTRPARELPGPITIQQLCQEALVFYDAQQGDRDPARRQLALRAQLVGLRPDPEIEVETVATAVALVEEGFGSTIIAGTVARSLGLSRRLRQVPFDEPLYETLAFVKRADQTLSSAAREMVRFTYESLGSRHGGPFELFATESDLIRFLH